MIYELELNKSTGGADKKDAPDMTNAKGIAKEFLNKDRMGSVEVIDPFSKQIITVYYRDINTNSIKDARYEAYIIAHNPTYPHTSAKSIVEARIKACALMKKEDWGMLQIYQVDLSNSHRGLFKDIGYIITNGYRYEYGDTVKNKRYTLNPNTGRISKY